jgi:Uma2 family endonuclease
MGQAAESLRFTREEYLEWEARQTERHEYVNGEIFALAGARRGHAIIALNIASELRNQLRGKPCRPFMADMKLQIDAADAFFYPDVLVTCDERDARADLQIEHPRLIIEVLSDSTAAYDLGLKFEYYRLVPELREYVVIEPDRQRIYAYRKNEAGEWLLRDLLPGEPLTLASVGCSITRDDIFEGVSVAEKA